MRVAVIGLRGLSVLSLGKYLPAEVTKIVSSRTRSVDTCARKYSLLHCIKLTQFLTKYENYAIIAPLKRNIPIIENALAPTD